MTELSTPVDEHKQFETLCSEVEDYEPLPELAQGPADTTPQLSAQEHQETIDAAILAWLVSP